MIGARLSHDAAEAVGRDLHDQMSKLTGKPMPFVRDDLLWADMVQLVLRRAAEINAAARGDLPASLPVEEGNG